MNPFAVPIADLAPSQLFVSAEKLARVSPGARAEPVPIRRLGGRLVLTDGHTRAVAAHRAGASVIACVWDTDDLDREAYETCVRWCREEGVRTVADLARRVVPAGEYERLWLDRCRALHESLTRRRAPGSTPDAASPSSSGVDYDRVAALYDLWVTADFDRAFFLEEAAAAGGPVLELGAGTGRLTLPLVEAGADVTAVDLSRGMLDRLEAKLADRGLAASVVCADAVDLPPLGPFALAIFPFHSMMEIIGADRRRAVLRGLRERLSPGGRFLVTLHNPAVRRRAVDAVLRVVGSFPAPDGTLVVSGSEHGGDPIVTRHQFLELYAPDGGLLSKTHQPMRFELIERGPFEEAVREAGFEVAALYGDYARSPFDPAASPAMIFDLRNGCKNR